MTDSTNTNGNYYFLGVDDHYIEQSKVSDGLNDLFVREFQVLSYIGFLNKIRSNFLTIEKGRQYADYFHAPKSFFYCPMAVSKEKKNANAAVFGECGIENERESVYAQCWIEDYHKLDGQTFLGKLFTSQYMDSSDITRLLSSDILESNKPTVESTYHADYIPEISEQYREYVACAAEKLCLKKTVILRLREGVDFNKEAKQILAEIMSLLPVKFRKTIGFITYIQQNQIENYRSQSNNIRILVVDSSVILEDYFESDVFSVVDMNDDPYEVNDDYVNWSRIGFAKREIQLEEFQKSDLCTGINIYEILPKMLELLREAEQYIYRVENEYFSTAFQTIKGVAEYYRTEENEICRIIPSAKEAFVKAIPKMMAEGVDYYELLIRGLASVDEKECEIAKEGIKEFVIHPADLILPIQSGIKWVRQKQAIQDSMMISQPTADCGFGKVQSAVAEETIQQPEAASEVAQPETPTADKITWKEFLRIKYPKIFK